MKIIITVPDYSPEEGVGYTWDENSRVECLIEDKYVLINANKQGLESLANCLLSLAQETVPTGNHIHLDDLRIGFQKGFLILQKKLKWD
jgi:hypothetical protein